MAFSEKFLEELTARNDIESVVSEYVRLDRRSGANLFGLCPFHSEKTGSFAVNPSKQIYHCFGCGKGGSVINFIMDIENLSFPEAVEFLAKRAGMQMPDDSYDRESKKKKRILALNSDAARYYFEQLSAPAGEIARAYIRKRGITKKYVVNFGLGYAPASWDGLRDAMKSKGYTDWELFDAGLVSKSDKNGRTSFYDKFRNRLMFPIINVQGNVIGFSGRTLGDDSAKYMNSPDTIVYDKSRNLFALNLAKKTKAGYMILVEGNVDVVSLHQAGFDSAVASLGTALTEEQARLISRFTGEVIIAYDNDAAGSKASQRAIGILEKLDLKVRVLQMEGTKDPDEFIKTKGADAFQKLIDESENHLDFRLRRIEDKYNLSAPDQLTGYIKEACAVIATVPDLTRRLVYSRMIADKCGLKTEQIETLVESERKQALSKAKKASDKAESRPERAAATSDLGVRYDNPRSANAEKGLIRLLYFDPSLARDPSLPSPEEFSAENLRRIYGTLLSRLRENKSISIASLGEELSPGDISLLVHLDSEPISTGNTDRALADYIGIIHGAAKGPAPVIDLNSFASELRKNKGFGENKND